MTESQRTVRRVGPSQSRSLRTGPSSSAGLGASPCLHRQRHRSLAVQRQGPPGVDELLRFLEGGGADVLVTWEASRSTRDLKVYVELRNICRANNVLWCYNGRVYDFSRSETRSRRGSTSCWQRRKSIRQGERILRSVRANGQAGRPHGKLLYGYERQYDGTGQFIAQVVRGPSQDHPRGRSAVPSR
jgi:hypothetical protein